MKKLSILFLLLVFSCSSQKFDFYSQPKIDAHVHVRTYDKSFVEQAQMDHFGLLTINTRSSSKTYIDEQQRYAIFQNKHYPVNISWAATFSMEHFGEPDWQQNTIAYLDSCFQMGAIAVKVWKDIGMTFRNPDSTFIMIDDERFDPVLDYIASKGKTLVAHIAEPRNCWLPVDSMTVNNDKKYFTNNPQYHMYLHPDYPSYKEIISSRDNMLAKHPDLRVVGCHLGSLEWSVDELAKRLNKYPNFAVDLSARICHLQVQDRNKVQQFIKNYRTRILYGTDFGVRETSDYQQVRKNIHNRWLEDWDYFTTAKSLTSKDVPNEFKGLKLKPEIVKDIFYNNAIRWYPEISEL